jgi:hypothetical protein
MNLNFTEALRDLESERAILRLANETTPPGDYLFNTLLPEENVQSYHIDSGSVVVRSTMAGMVGMDSPFPPGGQVESSIFQEETAKLANEVILSEKALRQLHDMVLRLRVGGGNANEAMAQTAFNFMEKLVVQPHWDRMEWLRARALLRGEIDWTFNKKRLRVNYGVPAGHITTTRTGNDAYHGSASKFWDDVIQARKLLRWNLRTAIAHPETIDSIVSNPVNNATVLDQSNALWTLRRRIGTTEQPDSDSRFTIQLVSYDREGEALNPSTGKAEPVEFMERGKILWVGRNERNGFRVGEGGTPDPDNDMALGYTHLAPTVEGDGAPGRWARGFTPQDRPWELRGQGVTNGLPVIEAPHKLVVTSTEMPS